MPMVTILIFNQVAEMNISLGVRLSPLSFADEIIISFFEQIE